MVFGEFITPGIRVVKRERNDSSSSFRSSVSKSKSSPRLESPKSQSPRDKNQKNQLASTLSSDFEREDEVDLNLLPTSLNLTSKNG
mmetsp:Transcript_33498/g.32960  ORF Transcript_33498/g.32960 Transcript_33498/m.32960 type:complete len:86 (+) Transcript_33498:51-308(+)